MGFFLFCILVAAYFEADRISTADLIKKHRQHQSNNTTVQPIDPSNVFNLKALSDGKLPNGVGKPHIKTVSGGCNGVSPTQLPVIPRPHSARRKKEPSFLLFNLIKKLFSFIRLPKLPALFKPTNNKTDGTQSATSMTVPEKESKLISNDHNYSNPELEHSSNLTSMTKTQLKRENSSSERDVEENHAVARQTHLNNNHKKGKPTKHGRNNDPDLIADLREHEMKAKDCGKSKHDSEYRNKSQQKKGDGYELPNHPDTVPDNEEEDTGLTYRGTVTTCSVISATAMMHNFFFATN